MGKEQERWKTLEKRKIRERGTGRQTEGEIYTCVVQSMAANENEMEGSVPSWLGVGGGGRGCLHVTSQTTVGILCPNYAFRSIIF